MIRRATPSDVDALLDLWRRAEASPSVTDTVDDLTRLVGVPHAAVFVAIDDGDGDGVAVGSVIAAFDGWRGNLYRLAVAPRQRRHGLARQLVATAEDWFRLQGAKRVSALVEGDRPVAQAFWSAAGFAHYEGMRRYTKSV